jgi:hypothetical protein
VKGDVLAFLDADDVWPEYKLKQQVAILELHPEAGMVYGNTQYWHSWTGKPEDSQLDHVPEPVLRSNTLVEPPALLKLAYPLGKGTSASLSNLVLRRETIERRGVFEESFRGANQLYEDPVFLTKVYLKEHVFVAGESEVWDRYRRHPDSCSATVRKTGQYHSVRQNYFNWLAEYLYRQEVKDLEIWSLLHKAQFETHSKQLKKFERDLNKERREVRRLTRRVRAMDRRAQAMDRRAQKGRISKVGKLSKRIRRFRANILGR